MVIDFHSHVLPGIDDGSASLEQSLEMLRMETMQGIETVVATPHFYAHRDDPRRFLERRARAAEMLRQAMADFEGVPRLEIGAEVYFFRGISSSDILDDLTVEGHDSVLIEMPHSRWSDSMYEELKRIYTDRGLTPIIAHVDRYISPFRTHGIPERLEELPVLVQANASFFLHAATRGMALKMLRDEKIHLLGSDCHNLDDRKPNLGPALEVIEKRLGRGIIERVNSYEDYALSECTI